MNRHLHLVAGLMAMSLLGAGCVTVGGTKTPARSPETTASAPVTDYSQAIKDCQETGGSFLVAAGSCMCGPGYFLSAAGECLTPDGIPGGPRGRAAREEAQKAKEAREKAEAATSASPQNTTSAPSGVTSVVTEISEDAAAAVAAKAADKIAQGKCGQQAEKYMETFSVIRHKAAGDTFSNYTMTSHYNAERGKCFALIYYTPTSTNADSVQTGLRRTRYESLGNVTDDLEVASCTDYVSLKNGTTSTVCYLEGEKFSTAVYNDYVRQRMTK